MKSVFYTSIKFNYKLASINTFIHFSETVSSQGL